MSQPWFEPNTFGALFGGIGGSAVGVMGGVIGTLAGVFAPQGKYRSLVLGLMWAMVVVGAASLVAGVVALVDQQPYAIWYPLLLLGLLSVFLFGFLIPGVRLRYRQAEQRRVEAEGLRRG